jgi:DNA-binding transcriptional MerR regulator
MTGPAGSTEVSERDHLSIGEVLALLQDEFPDVTISKIRFLESQGLLDPERTPSGYRKFYDSDIIRLRWILEQQRDHFLPLKVIKDRLAGERAGETPTSAATPAATRQPVTDRAAFAEALDRLASERGEWPAAPESADAPLAATSSAITTSAAAAAAAALDAGPSEMSLTTAELGAASGLGERDIDRLESFGLLASRSVLGGDRVYDGESLVVARLAAAFLGQGLEPRHLRMFKVAADREADVYNQLVTPLLRQRNPESRRRAVERLGELSTLGEQLRGALVRQELRRTAGG